MRTAPLPARIIFVLGLALIIAGVVAEAYGARTVTVYEGSIDVSQTPGAAIVVFSLSSNGVVTVEVNGASEVYYVTNISGDPMAVLRALSVFNIRLGETQMEHDVRSGLIRGYALINASEYLLQALPRISQLLHFNIEEARAESVNGSYLIREGLGAATGIVVLVVPSGPVVEYRVEYRLVGYERLPASVSAGVGVVLLGVGVAWGWFVGRSRGDE